MLIVVGLGNPGKEYARTRHNVGFDVIDVLSEKHGIALTKNAMHGLIGEGFVGGEKLVLVKPQTFMNLSGQCVTELVSWYKPEMDHLMVVYDDIDLPLGKKSGLVEALEVLKNVNDIAIVKLSHRDVVRHELVQAIVRAYEKYAQKPQTHKPRS